MTESKGWQYMDIAPIVEEGNISIINLYDNYNRQITKFLKKNEDTLEIAKQLNLAPFLEKDWDIEINQLIGRVNKIPNYEYELLNNAISYKLKQLDYVMNSDDDNPTKVTKMSRLYKTLTECMNMVIDGIKTGNEEAFIINIVKEREFQWKEARKTSTPNESYGYAA